MIDHELLLKRQARKINKLDSRVKKLEKAIIIITDSLCRCSEDARYTGGHLGGCCIREICELLDNEELQEKAQR